MSTTDIAIFFFIGVAFTGLLTLLVLRTMALRLSEQKYRDLYEHSPDMYAVVDLSTEQIVECNAALSQQLGFSKTELRGRSVRTLYQAESLATALWQRPTFDSTGELRDVERVLVRADGRAIDTSLTCIVAKRDAQGAPLLVRMAWRDISSRKKADRDREFLLRLGDVFRETNEQETLLHIVADKLARHIGVDRSLFADIDETLDRAVLHADYHGELVSVAGTVSLSSFAQNTASESRQGNPLVLHDALNDPRTRDGYAQSFGRLGVRAVLSAPLLRDGVWVGALVLGSCAPREWEPREIALLQLVAERVWLWLEQLRLRASVRAREVEERFRIIIDAVKDYAIIMLDERGHILTWNSGAQRIKGYEVAEVLGKHVSLLYTTEDRLSGHADEVLLLARKTGHYEEEGWRLRKDGSRFWASVVMTAMQGTNGENTGFAKVVRDISDWRLQQEALTDNHDKLEASLREREVLLQEIHHRVKNNLQVISSLINMQARQLDDTHAKAALDECKTRVEAIALIHEKLYQAHDYAHVPFSTYARSLARNVFHAASVSTSDVVLKVDIEDIGLPVDKAIPCGLILNELISNALKHAFPKGRTGAMTVSLQRLSGERLILGVRDDGVGIPDGFDFKRSSSLGLQLVETLTSQLHGQLQVSSNGGTAFQITFPLSDPAAQSRPS